MQDKDQRNGKSTSEATLNVFGYTDYRKYLRDFYEFRKQSARGYSYRAFSRAAGLSSPNFLKLVIENKRNLSRESIPAFVTALRLTKSMARYFEALVLMNQAKTDQEKDQYFHEIKMLIPESKRRDLNVIEHEYLSRWLHSVIREMVYFEDFRDDPYWISGRLNGKIKVSEIAEAFNFLKKEGFIVKEKERYKAVDNMVVSSDEIFSLAIRNYHREMLAQAQNSLETLSLQDREFGALTFALPESSLAELKERIKSFRTSIHEWACQQVEEQEAQLVVQLNFQMYPHTKRRKGEE